MYLSKANGTWSLVSYTLLHPHAAAKKESGSGVIDGLKHRGIIVKARSTRLVAEEAQYAYKDIEDVADVVEKAGLSKRVARLKPLAVIKG